MEYKQYTTLHKTEHGIIKLEYTYERINSESPWVFDELYATVNMTPFHLPKHWKTQTSETLIRKICHVFDSYKGA